MPAMKLAGPRRQRRMVRWDGRLYKVRSDRVDIPDLAFLPRRDALEWLVANTEPMGLDGSGPRAGLSGRRRE